MQLLRESDTFHNSTTSEDIYNALLDAYLSGLMEDHFEFRSNDEVYVTPAELNGGAPYGRRPPLMGIGIQVVL